MKLDRAILLGLMAVFSVIGIAWKDFAPFVILALLFMLYTESQKHEQTEERLEAAVSLISSFLLEEAEKKDEQSSGP